MTGLEPAILRFEVIVHTRVAKKPEFSKPAPPLIFDPSRVPAPKKLEAKKAQPALPRP